jgi:hypothetical protein
VLRKLLTFILCLQVATPAMAQTNSLTLLNNAEDMYKSRIAEYFYVRTGKEILKPVRLLGAVEKPGLYHLPDGTKLTSLLAISGGPRQEADLNHIRVSHPDGSTHKRDIDELIKVGGDVPLGEGDIVYVPRERELIKNSTQAFVLTLVSIVTMSLTAYVVFRND